MIISNGSTIYGIVMRVAAIGIPAAMIDILQTFKYRGAKIKIGV